MLRVVAGKRVRVRRYRTEAEVGGEGRCFEMTALKRKEGL